MIPISGIYLIVPQGQPSLISADIFVPEVQFSEY